MLPTNKFRKRPWIKTREDELIDRERELVQDYNELVQECNTSERHRAYYLAVASSLIALTKMYGGLTSEMVETAIIEARKHHTYYEVCEEKLRDVARQSMLFAETDSPIN